MRRTLHAGVATLLGLATPLMAAAGEARDMAGAYRRAAEFLPWRVRSWLPQDDTYASEWSADGSRFRYYSRGPLGERLMEGDVRSGRVRPVTAAAASPVPIALNPSGRTGVGLEHFNLWLIDTKSGQRTALTTDGSEGNAYSALYEFGVLLDAERRALQGPMRPAQGTWSPDGRYFLSFRYDQRAVGRQIYWYAVTDKGYGARPDYIEQRGAYPGEPNAYAELVVCDTQAPAARTVREARFETFLDPFTAGLVQWSADSRAVYFLKEGKGLRSVTVSRLDLADGSVRDLYTERSDTYLMLSGSRYPAIWRVLQDGRRMLWYSEHDGWGNLHLVDLQQGRIDQAVTRGAGVVTRLFRVDESSGWVYFLAGGRTAKLDPYFQQAWRVKLDGSAIELLTPEPADHAVSMASSGGTFLDVQSAGLAFPPRTVLRALDGKVLATVAETDDAALRARQWRAPQRVRVRSADDRYDVYGTVFRPGDYDPKQRYPVLDYIYGLSSLARAPKSFPLGSAFEMADSYWHSLAMAELGFIIVKLDAPGTPLRGRAFARESYGEGHVGAMLEHHIAALRQLAEHDPSMDLDRAGIFGSSGGGYTSTRAMLLHPEFFKAAVAFSSSQDLLRLYGPEWAERYIGPFESSHRLYEQLSNSTYAGRLRGKLLLVHGEADSEVTIAMDQQFVHALVAANRDFDMLYLPNAEHDLDSNPYAVRKRWDYLVRHLRNETPPEDFRMPDLP